MKILITGGAGYIGSHIVKTLGKKSHDLLIYDNLSTGHDSAITYGKLVQGELAGSVDTFCRLDSGRGIGQGTPQILRKQCMQYPEALESDDSKLNLIFYLFLDGSGAWRS